MISLIAVLATIAVINGVDSHGNQVREAPPFEKMLKIDAHSHIFDEMPEFVAMLQRTNTRVVNICVYGSRPELLEPAAAQADGNG